MREDRTEIDAVKNLPGQESIEIPDDGSSQDGKSFFKRLIQNIGLFLFKYKWIIVGAVSFVVLAIFSLYNLIGVIVFNNVKLVNFSTVVEIKDGQVVKNKAQNVSVEVSNFVNEPCPKGRKCFGNGSKSVEYIVTVDGQGYATGSATDETIAGYKVKTVDSDYKTYANIKIVESK